MQPHAGRASRPNARCDGCSAALPDQLRQARRLPGPRWSAGPRHGSAASWPASATRSSRRSTARPGSTPIARLLPPPSDGEVVEDRADRVAPRRCRGTGRSPATGASPWPRLPLDQIVEIKRAHRHDGQRRRRRRVRRRAARLARRSTTSCRSSPIVAMVPMLVGGDDSARRPRRRAGRAAADRHVADPAERLRRTSDALTTAKQKRMVPVPASLMQDVSLFAPPARRRARRTSRRRAAAPPFVSPTVNLAITNVPGSRQQMYLAGRPLEASYPVLTINDLSPLHIGLQSEPGRDRRRRAGRAATRWTTSTRSSPGCRVELESAGPGDEASASRAADAFEGNEGGGEQRTQEHQGAQHWEAHVSPSKTPTTTAAIFDLDRTLIAGPSATAFADSLARRRASPGAACPASTRSIGHATRLLGETDAHRPVGAAGGAGDVGLVGRPGRRGGRRRCRRADGDASSRTPPASSTSTARPAGSLVMATTSPAPLVTPFAERLGFDAVIATRWAIGGRHVHRRHRRPLVWGRGKLEAVRGVGRSTTASTCAGSYAYSDSYYDAPLLAAVGHADGRQPRRPPRRRSPACGGWPIRHFDLPDGVPQDRRARAAGLGAAAAAAGAAGQRPPRHRGRREDPADGPGDRRVQPPQLLRRHRRRHRARPDRSLVPLPRQEGGVRRAGHRRSCRRWPAASASTASSGSDEPLEHGDPRPAGRRGRSPWRRRARSRVVRRSSTPSCRAAGARPAWPQATGAPVHPGRAVGHREGVAAQPPAARASTSPSGPRSGCASATRCRSRYRSPDADTKRIMAALVDLLPPEAKVRQHTDRRGAGRHLSRPATRATRTREADRRPGTDT